MDPGLLTLASFAETKLSYAGKFTRFILDSMGRAELFRIGMVIQSVCILNKVWLSRLF